MVTVRHPTALLWQHQLFLLPEAELKGALPHSTFRWILTEMETLWCPSTQSSRRLIRRVESLADPDGHTVGGRIRLSCPGFAEWQTPGKLWQRALLHHLNMSDDRLSEPADEMLTFTLPTGALL